MAFLRWLAAFLLCAILCLISVRWWDAPVMRFLGRHYLLHQEALEIPIYVMVALLALPAAALAATLLAYRRRRVLPDETRVLALAGLAILGGVTLTELVLKPLFGRTQVNEFFYHPSRFEFNFLHGDMGGTFPSGHSAAAFAFLMVMWRHYPRWRPAYAVAAPVFVASLQAARWHFLSDILAGAFVGASAGLIVMALAVRRRADS